MYMAEKSYSLFIGYFGYTRIHLLADLFAIYVIIVMISLSHILPVCVHMHGW